MARVQHEIHQFWRACSLDLAPAGYLKFSPAPNMCARPYSACARSVDDLYHKRAWRARASMMDLSTSSSDSDDELPSIFHRIGEFLNVDESAS